MKKLFLSIALSLCCFSQLSYAQHLHEHVYPYIIEEDPRIRGLMDQVSIDSLTATIEHLSSYHTRRYDSRFIFEVKDWLYQRTSHLSLDTVFKHPFILPVNPSFPMADNVIGIQWGTTYPDEFVVCGAHYDSFAYDGYDPDTICSPGADDNATGVAGIIETARLLSTCSFDRSIMYCFFNAEEANLVGSAAFAKECAEQDLDLLGYFNMDMNGYLEEGSDIHVHLMYLERDSLLANYFYRFCHVYYPEMPICQSWLVNADSDHSSFHRNGYASLFPFEDTHASSPYIHSRYDVMGLSVNNMEQSKRFAELNLGAVAILAGLNSFDVEENESVELSIYPNPAQNQIQLSSILGLNCINMYNNLGQNIYTKYLDKSISFTLDVSGFSPGLYVVSVATPHGTVNKTIVIE